MTNLRRFAASLALVCWLASAWGMAQQKDYLPPELQASDPQVKAYLDAATNSADNGDYSEASQQLQKALDFCAKNSFLGDQALIEARLSSAYFLQGKLEDAKRYRLSSFTDSLKTNNLVLQSDNLAALAAIAQVSGGTNEALDFAGKALDLARKSKNLWIQARASGELGRMQLLAGKVPEARASVEEALRFDRLNQYAWEASHLLYLAWITSTDDSRLDQALALAASARELAIRHEDYLTFLQASAMLAHGSIHQGKVNEGIALLEHSRDGMTADGKPIFPRPASYRAASALTYTRTVFLEALAIAYQSGKRPGDALRAWSELYELARNAGFNVAAAESAHRMADLLQANKEFAKAAPWYALAVEGWVATGNTQRRMDALAGQAYVLFQQEEGGKALKIEEELLLLANSAGEPRRSFLAEAGSRRRKLRGMSFLPA